MIEQKGIHSPLYGIAEEVAEAYRKAKSGATTTKEVLNPYKQLNRSLKRRGEGHLTSYVTKFAKVIAESRRAQRNSSDLKDGAEGAFKGIQPADSRRLLTDTAVYKATKEKVTVAQAENDISKVLGAFNVNRRELPGLVMDVFIQSNLKPKSRTIKEKAAA